MIVAALTRPVAWLAGLIETIDNDCAKSEEKRYLHLLMKAKFNPDAKRILPWNQYWKWNA